MIKIETNRSLLNLNTFNVKAKASAFLQLDSVNELNNQKLLDTLSNYKNKLFLGGGSNLLFVGDFNGLVIYPQLFGIKVIEETKEYIKLKVAASENWHSLVTDCLNKGYYGLENLALIPGTVGAAPVQNIGAYGVEVEKMIESVECFDLLKNKFILFSHAKCQFSYRNSFFKESGQGRYLVCSVNFRLSKLPSPVLTYEPLRKLAEKNKNTSPRDVYDWVCELRKAKLPDPAELSNAGSFFKNPVISEEHYLKLKNKFPNIVAYQNKENFKIAAGWLIDHAGLKGKTINGVGIHKKQALVLVNYSESDGEKIWQLACMVISKIKTLYDIDLEPEVRVLGIKIE